MSDQAPIRLLLVDDHPLVLDGISSRLQVEDGIEVVGQASNGKEALETADKVNPHVVLMDVTMPVMGGLEATRLFKQQMPGVRVLILTMHDAQEYILKLMQSGASGYVLKNVSSEELIKAIETVYQGNTYFSAGASRSLFSGNENRKQKIDGLLTKREETVLKLIAEGDSNKEIANSLNISVRTVETHRQNIKSKLDIHTAAGLTRYAIEIGLIEL